MKVANDKLALPDRYKIAVPLGAGSGMRQGELFGFAVDAIDREEMMLRDAGFTLRTYTHLMPSSAERTRRAIDGEWGSGDDGTDASDGPETA